MNIIPAFIGFIWSPWNFAHTKTIVLTWHDQEFFIVGLKKDAIQLKKFHFNL